MSTGKDPRALTSPKYSCHAVCATWLDKDSERTRYLGTFLACYSCDLWVLLHQTSEAFPSFPGNVHHLNNDPDCSSISSLLCRPIAITQGVGQLNTAAEKLKLFQSISIWGYPGVIRLATEALIVLASEAWCSWDFVTMRLVHLATYIAPYRKPFSTESHYSISRICWFC